jgi:peptide/nickel transport system substrate-binding protein
MGTAGLNRRKLLASATAVAGAVAMPAVVRAQTVKTLVVAIPSNPSTLDPINQGNHDAMVANQLIFENLLEIDGQGRRQPMLARALPTVSDDRMRYVFDLRDDVVFQNGQPFTAEDVKYSYDFILDPNNKALRRAVWTPIEAIEVLGRHKVEFRLKTPYRPFLDFMTKYMGIFPAGSREKHGAEVFQQRPEGLGTGPGVFVSARTNDVVEFRRNPNYWVKGKPGWDVLRVRVIAEDAARLAALMSGEVHVIGAPPARDFLRLRQSSAQGLTGGSTPALGSLMLMVHNTKKAPFDDLDFRLAVSYATDRKTIAERIFYGLVEPSALPTPASAWWHDAKAAEGLAFNMEKAKAHLAKSRHASNAAFELMYSTQPYLLDTKDAALFIQATMAQIGIKVTLQPVETGQLIGQTIAGNQTSALTAVIGPSDPTFMIQSIYTPGQSFSRGSGYENPRITQLLADSWKVDDEASLRPVLSEMQTILAADVPSTWIGAIHSFNLWRTGVTGFEPNTGITLRLRDVALA